MNGEECAKQGNAILLEAMKLVLESMKNKETPLPEGARALAEMEKAMAWI